MRRNFNFSPLSVQGQFKPNFPSEAYLYDEVSKLYMHIGYARFEAQKLGCRPNEAAQRWRAILKDYKCFCSGVLLYLAERSPAQTSQWSPLFRLAPNDNPGQVNSWE